MKEYDFTRIEKKWQKYWEENKTFISKDETNKKNYYVLSMFPYPSGKLHMGHISNYTIGDAISKFMILLGYNVMQPMGYDAFGLPAENYAQETGSHPKITTENNIKIMENQQKMMGFGFDWERKIVTCDKEYYKWNQWLFKKLYKMGLVYKKYSFVNWCPRCKTVLAKEQVEEGKCWRCKDNVIQKEMDQWFFKITNYAEDLLDYSNFLQLPEKVRVMQENWIGKSIGAEINLAIDESKETLKVFTTRPDTIFGLTFMAIAPEHPYIKKLQENKEIDEKIIDFCNKVINENKISRFFDKSDKKGIFSGKYCINPVNGEKIPLWITNYVLMDYGTGVVMAVPAHDQRDFEFAKKYNLPLKVVIQDKNASLKSDTMSQAYEDEGILVNSAQFDGMNNLKAIEKIVSWMQDKKIGEKSITYKLRDWCISRQRYWGTPIPVIYCDKCGIQLEKDENLPLELPQNIKFGKHIEGNPINTATSWIKTKCPKCGADAKRETDTMDTFVDSSWYYARYCDNKNKELPFSYQKSKYWLPIDQYIGGIEHATLHLLYIRFFHKAMRDMGLLEGNEPFLRLLTQGMVCNFSYKCKNTKVHENEKYFPESEVEKKEVDKAEVEYYCKICNSKLEVKKEKMSKSLLNGIDPEPFINRYGSDALRVFMLFASPPEKDSEWNDTAVSGAFRFLSKVWNLFQENISIIQAKDKEIGENDLSEEIKNLRYSSHYTIKKVFEEIKDNYHFNVAISNIMIHVNNLKAINELSNDSQKQIFKEACKIVPILLYPLAPHISEELWKISGEKESLHLASYPKYEEKYFLKENIKYAIQVQGKLRGVLETSISNSKEKIIEKAKNIPNVNKSLQEKTIVKIIYVEKRLINFIVK